MDQRFQAQHALAFGINLQGQASAEDLEDRQIIRRFLDHDLPTPGRAVLTVKGGPSFVSQDGLEALNPQRGPTAVDHRLKHLLHSSAALKEQVAAVLALIDGVRVVEFASLLLLPAERKTEAGGVNPTLRHPAQAPYHPFLGQGVCDLSQGGGVLDLGKTIPLLLKLDLLAQSLAGHIFMTVQDDLRRKGRMARDFDRDVSPLRIPDMERVVVDVGHGLLPLQVVLAGRFPDGCLSLANQNQKQPRLARMVGQVLFSDLVFPLASLALDHGNASGLGESPQATAEAARPPQEVGVVEMLFRPLELLPPGSEPPAGVTHPKIGVQDNSVHAIIAAFEKVPVTFAQRVWHRWHPGRWLQTKSPATVCHAGSEDRHLRFSVKPPEGRFSRTRQHFSTGLPQTPGGWLRSCWEFPLPWTDSAFPQIERVVPG